SRAMWWFLGYIAVFVGRVLFIDEKFVEELFASCFTQVQLAVLFWIASDLLREQKMARRALLTYSMASAFVAVGNILQLPGFYEESAGRATAFADNPNEAAGYMAVAAVITMGLYLYASYRHFLSKILLLVMVLPLLLVLVKTGSRGMVA